jgi:hypothetical protein
VHRCPLLPPGCSGWAPASANSSIGRQVYTRRHSYDDMIMRFLCDYHFSEIFYVIMMTSCHDVLMLMD